jgi:predicted TIM-barrel fold metal-dependent hydrolase
MSTYYNSHIHVFNFRNTPEDFLSIKIPLGIAKIANAILNKPFLAKILFATLKPFVGANGNKMLAFLKIGLKKTPEIIFEDLITLYPNQDDVKFIILPLDFSFMNAGLMDKVTYVQQLEELFSLKLKYPTKAFPFVAIDPRSDSSANNMQFVKSYIVRGFSGIKLYPALGYFGYHPDLFDTYSYAEKNCIPILTHCSKGGVNMLGKDAPSYLINPECFNKLPDRNYNFPQTGKMEDFCDYMNNPENFDEVLAKFPKLKICFAHLGIDAKNKFKVGSTLSWYKKILDLMAKYPNVYTDVSYTVAYKDFIKWFVSEYETYSDSIKNRILYGTDFFMTLQEDNGNDDEILSATQQGLGNTVFMKLAFENVERFLSQN